MAIVYIVLTTYRRLVTVAFGTPYKSTFALYYITFLQPVPY